MKCRTSTGMSSARSRSGGTTNGEHVQAIVEVFAERAVANPLLQVAVRGGDDPGVDANRCRAAEPLELPLLEHPQQLHLDVDRQIANLVEEHRRVIGDLEPADLPRHAPVKAPRSRPNSSLSMSVAGMAAQLTRTIGRAWRALSSWILEARNSLPVPVSPSRSTVESVGRDLIDQLHHPVDRGTPAGRRVPMQVSGVPTDGHGPGTRLIAHRFGVTGTLLVSDVHAGSEIPLEPPVGADIRHAGVAHPAPLAIMPEQPVLHRERLARVEARVVRAQAFSTVVRVDVFEPALAELVLERMTDEFEPAAVEPAAPLVRPAHPDHHGGVVGERAEAVARRVRVIILPARERALDDVADTADASQQFRGPRVAGPGHRERDGPDEPLRVLSPAGPPAR